MESAGKEITIDIEEITIDMSWWEMRNIQHPPYWVANF